jgi:hypothetical protein
MSNLKFIFIVATATMIFLASCGKNSDNPTPDVPLTDSCTACDKLKQDILSNPNYSDLHAYIDSLRCVNDGGINNCILNLKNGYIYGQYNSYPPYSKISYNYGLLENSNYGKYKYAYICDRATADTPFVFPLYLMVDFDESRPTQRGITAYIVEFDQYLDSIYNFNQSTGKYGYTNSYTSNHFKYPSTGFVQFGDTVKWELRGKKVTENGITTTYPYMRYNFVMSPDMETMHLIVTVKKDYPISTSPVYRTFSSCILKRVK